MKILVLGASGMAGHMITLFLQKKGHKVTALTRKSIPFCDNIILDITNFSRLKSVIEKGDFNVVINAIGILNKDAEINKAYAVQINSYLPHFLVDITQDLRTNIIHISTDCVFSGKTGKYEEISFKDAYTFYGRSKALGEIDDDTNLTIRTSIIGPDLKIQGIGLLNWFMSQLGDIKGFTKAIWSGVTTLELAKAIDCAINNNLTGLYHLVNNQEISKYELVKLFKKYFDFKNNVNIIPYDKVKVNKSLVNTRSDFCYKVPSYDIMVKDLKTWMLDNKNLYKHYKLENKDE